MASKRQNKKTSAARRKNATEENQTETTRQPEPEAREAAPVPQGPENPISAAQEPDAPVGEKAASDARSETAGPEKLPGELDAPTLPEALPETGPREITEDASEIGSREAAESAPESGAGQAAKAAESAPMAQPPKRPRRRRTRKKPDAAEKNPADQAGPEREPEAEASAKEKETASGPAGELEKDAAQPETPISVPDTMRQTAEKDALLDEAEVFGTAEGETAVTAEKAESKDSIKAAGEEPSSEAKKTAEPETEEQDDEMPLPKVPAGLLCPRMDSFELPAAPEGIALAPEAERARPKPKKKAKKKKKKHHYFFWTFVLMTLLFAGGSAYYIYWMFTESESTLFDVKADVELPNLLGRRWAEVQQDESVSGFTLELVEVYHDEAPAGEIVDQNPRPPRHVKENSHIIVKVSKGVETVTVPDLSGWNRDTAREKLREMNLTLLVKPEENSDVPVDSVIRTEPESGTLVKAGTTITLYISREEQEITYVTVPTCIGAESESQAGVRLSQRGLLMRVKKVEDAAPEGTVIDQSPSPGAMVIYGSTVTLTVSQGPPPSPPEPDISIPDIDLTPIPPDNLVNPDNPILPEVPTNPSTPDTPVEPETPSQEPITPDPEPEQPPQA